MIAFINRDCYNYDVVNKDDLRAINKKEYGEGFEFTYTKENGELGHCKESENVPAECVESGRWLYSLKSTTRYTKKADDQIDRRSDSANDNVQCADG